MSMRRIAAAVTGWALIGLAAAGQEAMLMSAPSGDRYVELNPEGETVLPNGRLITPVGRMFRIHPHPYGMTLSRDGRWLITANSGNPVTLSILDLADPESPVLAQIPEKPAKDNGILDAVYMGLAVDPGNRVVYAAGGRDWSVMAFDLQTRERLFRIDCAHRSGETFYEHGYVGDLRLSNDGNTIYALDQSNFRFLIVSVPERKVVRSVEVGRYPFGLALHPSGKKAYVANVGMYEYSWLRDEQGNKATLDFPPFGVPSKEAEEGVTIDGVRAEGLGDPNDIRGMSVWTLDLSTPGEECVVGKAKSGHLVGEQLEDFPAVGGSSPNSLVATERFVFVSNGSNDSLTILDSETGARLRDLDLVLNPRVSRLRGMIPFGLALSPDRKRLYVAEAGINAVGVVDISGEEPRVVGHIPAAWFPSRVAVSPDGRTLYVANAKGIGSGPNAGPGHRAGDPTGVGDLMRGYIQVLPLPASDDEYAALTRKVLDNNVRFSERALDPRKEGHPVPPVPGAWKSPIRHVVYVTKENRTYDEVFGALPGGRGDAELCRLGRPITVESDDKTRKVENVLLMPNHIALAKRFAINDNFYCDSDHSTDGHRWLVGTYPNEFVEAKIGEDAKGEGPGNFAFIGASGAVYPEDYNEGGAIWEHFDRNGIRFFNFGLGFEFAYNEERQQDRFTGERLWVNYPMPKVLFDNTSRTFATYNTNIPDQFRLDMFERDFREKWLSGKEPFPRVVTMMLPNDHGARERPADGYPFWGSYMSDNDLALGRLVELISHSPWWNETVIFVTEDDAQGYRDTVDAHRSICMAIGPYVKKGHISHTHSSIASILKTIFLILGLPPLNQYDAFASDLADMFAGNPDNGEPYSALPVNPEVFDPQKALDPFDAEFNWKAVADFVPLDDQEYLDMDPQGHLAPTP